MGNTGVILIVILGMFLIGVILLGYYKTTKKNICKGGRLDTYLSTITTISIVVIMLVIVFLIMSITA